MTVEAICKRLVYSNLEGTYRVYAFRPTNPESEMNLTKYGDFTIAGEREFSIDKVYTMDVEPNKDSKYPASYQFIKYTGMEYDGERFAVEPQMRFKVLSSYMTEGQAMSCLDAYPDFIDRVLMGNIDTIDVNKIKGVGNILLNKYVAKLKDDTYSIMFGTVLSKYGEATPKACKLAAEKYVDPEDLEHAIVEDPYETLCAVLDKKVKSVDKFVRDVKPEYLESKSRCRRAVFDLLHELQNEGSTRCNANMLAQVVKSEYPECIKWIHEVITESPELYYDTATKYVSLLRTFQDEVFVAKQIAKRVKNPVRFEGETEQFRQVGDCELTDEQMGALGMIKDNSVGMLTAPGGCVDADTEYFNGSKWKRIADYIEGDRVLQYNIDGTAELVEPSRYIKQPCDHLWHFETKYGINQTVCDEHRIVYWSPKGAFHECKIKDIIEAQEEKGWSGKFATTFKYEGSGITLTDEEIRIMCAVICDGSFYSQSKEYQESYNTCRFHIKKERKKERLRQLFFEANYEWRETESAAEGYTDFYIQAPIRTKVFDSMWYNCTNHQLQVICDEVLNWDGSFNMSAHGVLRKRFSTNVKQTADFIQFAFSACGYRASILTRNRVGQKYLTCGKWYTRKSEEYNVTITNRTMAGFNTDGRDSHTKTAIQQVLTTDGYKYCFTVPSHMLVLRRANRIFITGNCGKSFSTLAIVRYLESINKSYVLLAPTGCAAKRLHEATDRKASTIHMWIMKMLPSDKKDDFNYSPTNSQKCQANVVICDEASMLSVDLVAKVFDWVSDHTKVFFVCDPAQLASISCGNFAQDLMDSGVAPITRLTKVFRYNTSGIATVVTDTRNGTAKSLEDKYDDYHFVQQADTASEVIDQISKVYQHFLKKGYKMMDILCLCPYNRGVIGTRIINNVLQDKFNKNPYLDMGYVVDDTNINFKIGDKIINTKNNYNAKLYPPCYNKKGEEYYEKTFLANGDIGRIDCIFDELLVCDFDGRLVIFEKPEFRNLSLAYAISCHKSQGQESPVVIALMLRQHTYMINRNIEYVAFSRAKKELCIIGDVRTISRGMRDVQNLQRNTWLVELLTGRKI